MMCRLRLVREKSRKVRRNTLNEQFITPQSGIGFADRMGEKLSTVLVSLSSVVVALADSVNGPGNSAKAVWKWMA
jgi:hypothetical protein